MSLLQRIIACRAEARPVPEQTIAFDVVFVLHVSGLGWILEKICRAIATNGRCSYKIVFSERNELITAPLPRARSYFFAHYGIYCSALARHPELHAARLFVWFTHPDFSRGIGAEEVVFALRLAERIFTANATHARMLGELGLPRARLTTVYGAADPALFRPKRRGGGKVGFIGAYYERKSPDKILEIIRAMPEVEFLLLGPDEGEVENKGLLWSNFPRIGALRALPNLEIVETSYAQYPEHFARLDVYVSVATLEGGPIPLVEALMSNTMPVVTRTGFAEELITDRRNGYLLPVDTSIEAACEAITEALADRITDVSEGTDALSWAGFGHSIADAMRAPLAGAFTLAPGEDGLSHHFLRHGWRVPDGDGHWQFAPSAVVALPLAAGARLDRLELTLEAGAMEPPGRFLLGCVLNGVELCAAEGEGGARMVIPLDAIPPGASRPGEDNFLELRLLSDPAPLLGDDRGRRILRLERIAGVALGEARDAVGFGVPLPQPAAAGGAVEYGFQPGGNGHVLLGLGWGEVGCWGLTLEADDGHLILPVAGAGRPLDIALELRVPGGARVPRRVTVTDGLRAVAVPVPAEAGPATLELGYALHPGARLLRLEVEGAGLVVTALRVTRRDGVVRPQALEVTGSA
jgi:glycosyltransferase involved in cell wall biosynthesis